MRRLKKGCAVVIALALSMSFMTGCGDSNSKSGELNNKSTTTDATEAADSDGSGKASAEFASIDDMENSYAADVELGDYKGIEYVDKTEAVTDEEVQAKVDQFVDGLATFDKDTTSAAKSGDTVNIDFVGTVDGVEFEGGNTNGSGYDLVLGSGSFIDDFEDQIVGHKAGDTFVVKATFPENYGKDELNGKEAEFKTTLNYIKINKPATYNDKLVADNTSYKTTAEYEKSVREQLEKDKAASALASAQNEVMVNVINNSKINNVSSADIQANADKIISSLKTQAENYGVDYATYIYYYYGYDDEDSFANYVQQVCEESQKEKMIVCAVAKTENISVTDTDADEYIKNYAANNNVDEDSIRSNLTDVELKYNALAEKVMNFLMENAKATKSTEASTEAAEDTTAADSTEATEAAE